jgi:uncharacterized membrane protein
MSERPSAVAVRERKPCFWTTAGYDRIARAGNGPGMGPGRSCAETLGGPEVKVLQVVGLWIFMAIFGLVTGIGLLLAKVDDSSVDNATKIVPWGRLFRYLWFRCAMACMCLLLSAVSTAKALGWIG